MKPSKDEADRIHSDLGLSGKPLVSYRVTQLYTTGVCVYFTYGAYTRGHDGAEVAIAADQRLRRHCGCRWRHLQPSRYRQIPKQVVARTVIRTQRRHRRAMKHELDAKNVFGVANGVFHTG